MGHADLWSPFKSEVFSLDAQEATGGCLSVCGGEESHLIRPALGLCHAEEEGIGRGPELKQGDLLGGFHSGSETDDGDLIWESGSGDW